MLAFASPPGIATSPPLKVVLLVLLVLLSQSVPCFHHGGSHRPSCSGHLAKTSKSAGAPSTPFESASKHLVLRTVTTPFRSWVLLSGKLFGSWKLKTTVVMFVP